MRCRARVRGVGSGGSVVGEELAGPVGVGAEPGDRQVGALRGGFLPCSGLMPAARARPGFRGDPGPAGVRITGRVITGCGFRRECRRCHGLVGVGSGTDGGFVEVAVDGAAGHGEHGGDLGDGVLPGVVEALGEGGLVGAEFGGSSTAATAGPRGGESVAGVGHDEFPLQLGEHREHPEHGPSLGGGGVDALLHHLQANPAVTQLRTQGDQVQHGSSEPIQPGHHQHIPVSQDPQHQVQLRPRGLSAAGVVDMDVVPGDPGPGQGVGLVVRVLLSSGDPRVTRPAFVDNNPSRGLIDVVSRRELSTLTTCVDAHWLGSVGK